MPTTTRTASITPEQDPRWAAVAAREPQADDDFYYAVITTGVYCRPSCAARRPRPENVRYYSTAAAAAAAGFRPCKRCRPDQDKRGNGHTALVATACRMIERAEEAPSLKALAAGAGLSPHYFHRLFKQATGLTPRQYAAAHRERRLRRALGQGAAVTDAIFTAGYNATSRFYSRSREVLGMTPSDYRAGGANTHIRFAVGQSSLGSVLVAQSGQGVCAISLGDDPKALVCELQDQFPNAELQGDDPGFGKVVARVIALVENPGADADLPLDVRGTAFQQQVWQALRTIPAGATASYGEIARRIGRPRAVRAVAQACAKNRLAIAIPCHRVVRNDGSLSGYRWGVERKQALLEREAPQ